MELTNPTDAGLWLRGFRTVTDADVRLVCFPHAGGAASYFRPLTTALAPTVDARAVQYPGRQDRRNEPLVDNITELADQVMRVLADDLDAAEVPTVFFGHSMGAIVAYEVARRWEQSGRTLTCLFASGRRAPSLRPRVPVPMRTDADALAVMKRLSGTDDRLLEDEEILQMVLPVMRNDFRAAEAYLSTSEGELRCPIVAAHGDDDPHVFAQDADRWRRHTTGTFESHILEGGHFYLDNQYERVAELVMERLGRLGIGLPAPLRGTAPAS